MNILKYIVNLSIFSFMVCTPLAIRSLINPKSIKQFRFWGGLYGGFVSVIIVLLTIPKSGFAYDIRYAAVVLVFAYLGPVAGVITGSIALSARLMVADQWYPAIIGWIIIMIAFLLVHIYISRFKPIKRCLFLFGAFVLIYIMIVPVIFNIFRDNFSLHFQYLLFTMIGVVIGALMIELNEKWYMIISEKKSMTKKLEASEAKYRLIAENTTDLIMVVDKNRFVSYFSPSHEVVLGYQSHDLGDIKLYQLIHPDDVDLFKNTIERLFESKESQSMEFRLIHKQGHSIEFESSCKSVMGDDSLIEHVVIISRNISERKKAEDYLLQSEKLSIVGELAAGVAHEIRNPLTTVKGFVQIYKSKHDIEFTDLLLSELERIESITSELLTLGKPQAIKMNRINLRELIENTLELLLPQANMNNIQLKLSYEAFSFFVTCEKNQLKQVLINILKNAIEAMPEGGEIRLHIRKDVEGECVISVEDQGCGIPEELLPRLGEPFYSLKEKGTGLGLMICHKIIRQHRGRITYQSKLNEGTIVEIMLPLTG